MSDYPGAVWLDRYRERVNGDRELNVIGEWFTTTFTLSFGDNRYALKIDKGKIADIVAAPRLDVRSAFGFAAPVEVWRKFLSPDPPPLYHDFFAMLMRVPQFRLEGDKFITKVDVAWNEAWVGTDQVRFWRIEGNKLHIIGAPIPNPNVPGSMVIGILVWERE